LTGEDLRRYDGTRHWHDVLRWSGENIHLAEDSLDRIAVTVFVILCTFVAYAEETGVTKINSVRLYLPDAAMKERVGDVKALVAYLKTLQQEAEKFWASSEQPGAKGVLVAVGVKADGKSRVWCEAVSGEIPVATLEKFRAVLEKVKPVAVKGGPIAFAMGLGLRNEMPEEFPVMPQLWSDAVNASKESLVVPDGLFKVIWPD